LKCIVFLVHGVVIAVGLSIPLVLAGHTIFRDGHIDLNAWGQIANDLERWRSLLVSTIHVGGMATLIATSAGGLLGCLAFKTKWPGRNILVLIIVLLACSPGYVTSSAILTFWGLVASFESASIAALIHGLMYIPLASLLIGLGLLFVDTDIEEAALLDYTRWQVILRMTIPHAAWSIIASALVIFVLVITDYSVTDVLQVRCFAEEIFTQFQLKGERATPFLLAVPVMVLISLIFWVLKRGFGNLARPLLQGPRRKPILVSLKPRECLLAWSVTAILFLASVWAFARLFQPLENQAHFLETYKSFSGDWPRTIWIALSTGIIVALLSLTFSWMLVTTIKLRYLIGAKLVCLISIPAPALAMTLVWFTNHASPDWLMSLLTSIGIAQDPFDVFYHSSVRYVLAIGLRFLPIAVLLVLPAVYRLPHSLEDAARSDGADWLTVMWRIYLPEAKGNVFLATLVVMILAVGEVDCSYLMAPPGKPTLSVRFFTFIHFGLDHQIATLCLAAQLTTFVPGLVLFGLGRKKLMGLER